MAFDLGASSGRAIIGEFDGYKISLTEIHRFPNVPLWKNGTLYWDFPKLLNEIKQGLTKSKPFGKLDGIGIDTWGVDFGLLDKNGKLLENPVHYRDGRTARALPALDKKIGLTALYERTGTQLMSHNTICQLAALAEQKPDLLKRADALLMIPDLFAYFLCGVKQCESSAASTVGLTDVNGKGWLYDIADMCGIPRRLFQPIIPSGTRSGKLLPSLCGELEIEPSEVIAVCGHDTQCALAAVPATEKDFAFLSSGTWSLLGAELDNPIVNTDDRYKITNERGFENKVSFLKNLTGLWLLQQLKSEWEARGEHLCFAEMEALARNAPPFVSFIDTDAPRFAEVGGTEQAILDYCAETAQPVPQNKAAVLRAVYESLAMKYRYAFYELQKSTEKSYGRLYLVGGGVKDATLCQMTADACGIKVVAGASEATVLGNLVIQLSALGKIGGLNEARKIAAASSKTQIYKPRTAPLWQSAYKKYLLSTVK